MPPLRAILFDLDGTLIDSEAAAAAAISSSFESWGLEIEPVDAGYITGRTWAAAFDYLFEKYPLPIPRADGEEQMMAAYRKALRTEMRVVPGAPDCVRALAQAGYRLALVSGSNRSEILYALDHLGVRSLFEAILGAEDYARSKPAPDGYLRSMELLGVSPGECLCFEDSTAGVASARAAGVRVVAVTGTNHFGQNTAGADHFVPDLRGIDARWISRLPSEG